MKFLEVAPARVFRPSPILAIEVSHCADITLSANELVTFKQETGSEYDVVRKDWGFYATPSTNERLPEKGFRTALMRNESGRIYIVLVEKDQMGLFEKYLLDAKQRVIGWLDDTSFIDYIDCFECN